MISDLLIPTDTAVWPQWYKAYPPHKYITTFSNRRYSVSLKYTGGVDVDFYSLVVHEILNPRKAAVLEIPIPSKDVIDRMEDLMRNFETHMVLMTL